MASLQPRLRAAAEIIARDARARASVWSEQIPPSIKVRVAIKSATISTSVGPAYPNEVPRVRHPVFETPSRIRVPWVTNQYRPFLAPAAVAKADEATREIAKYIDDVCHDLGFKGTG